MLKTPLLSPEEIFSAILKIKNMIKRYYTEMKDEWMT